MRLWLKLFTVFAAILMLGVALMHCARLEPPIKEGTSIAFWEVVCGVALGRPTGKWDGLMGNFYPPRDGYCIYYIQGYHGQFLYRVPIEAAAADLAAVAQVLDKKKEADLKPDVKRGFLTWKRLKPSNRDTENLLTEIWKAKLERKYRENRKLYDMKLADEDDLGVRLERAERFWATLLFEFSYLSAILVFAVYPWLKKSGRVGWSVHLGLVPLLVLLPHMLGYVPLVFTSAYPAGGVFYPEVVRWFALFAWTSFDSAIMQHMPPVLEPLCQPLGPMLSLSGMNHGGPISAVLVGLVIGIFVFGVGTFVRWRRSRTAPTTRCAAPSEE